jgi:hypothetical protein
MGDVALEIPLRAFAVRRRGQSHGAHDAGVQALRDALDDAALAGAVAPLEDDDDLFAAMRDPVLQLDEFGLKLEEGAQIGGAVDRVGVGGLVDARHLAREDGILEIDLEILVEIVRKLLAQPGFGRQCQVVPRISRHARPPAPRCG